MVYRQTEAQGASEVVTQKGYKRIHMSQLVVDLMVENHLKHQTYVI